MKIQPDIGQDRVWPWMLGVLAVVVVLLTIVFR